MDECGFASIVQLGDGLWGEELHADLERAELALAVSGHAQALLLNFEEEIVATFGDKYSLAHILRFPAIIGTFTDDGEKTLRRLRDKLPADLKRFIAEFHSGLPDGTGPDPRFELRLRVVLERVVCDPEALSMQFTRWDDMTDAEKELVQKMGKRGQTVIREQKRSVVGHGLLGAGEAERRVAAAIPYRSCWCRKMRNVWPTCEIQCGRRWTGP